MERATGKTALAATVVAGLLIGCSTILGINDPKDPPGSDSGTGVDTGRADRSAPGVDASDSGNDMDAGDGSMSPDTGVDSGNDAGDGASSDTGSDSSVADSGKDSGVDAGDSGRDADAGPGQCIVGTSTVGNCIVQ